MSRRVVVTGGAGFLGSHLCEALLRAGDTVVAVDNLCTGLPSNLDGFSDNPRFQFVEADVSEGIPLSGPVDVVAHLACPASPPEYLRLALETLAVGSRGTQAAVDLAMEHGARLVFASTSEVYGDPTVHPQPESYWGNVNPVGPRSVYDESKRFSEALLVAHARYRDANVGIVRIFNTYGPRLRPQDGRVVSNFIAQALSGEPLTIYGSGSQTRSFCYVDDLIAGLLAMINSQERGPINIGNSAEMTVAQLADLVLELTGSGSKVVYEDMPVDDPLVRQPDITLASTLLGWRPVVDLRDGLLRTIEWHKALAEGAGGGRRPAGN
ncbi:SDR family oxidoreductase [Acidiferrimicrobium sp. IK]|uniref:UDP-glucuronic acid decarboxylase family protein n=1 Tax=Acidiferrimicrobium sp. IK TaxID=2871700 RepID=UPI0021CB4AA7|nr:UDP-glucuronic acid decarboxylase family protein [Acidiferrimicrobium sp. IK]MCU4184280.1 SDR family oxidoreductase [Acidiferrimicrobium sp. IK]